MGALLASTVKNIISFYMYTIKELQIAKFIHHDREHMTMQQPGRVSSAQYNPYKPDEHDDSANGLFSYLFLFKQKMAEYHTE